MELTLKQKIQQMFITGFTGRYDSNQYLRGMLKSGLGGIIFFSHNIETKEQFKSLTDDLSKEASIPLFLSIDQEGGRVERTEAIHNGKKYLSAADAFEKGEAFLKSQTREIALELKSFGINMNFAPVLDVNTNQNNPIIGSRAYSCCADEVISASKIVIEEYSQNGIIPVGKHFPGHGDSCADSHKTLPVIDLPFDELEKTHIRPFKAAIENGLDAIMAAHVFYPEIEKDNTPASVSKKIIKDILIDKLKFNGVIITDDMEMNGIKGYTRLEAAIKAINAGVCMFIFRNTTEEIFNLVADIETAVQKGLIDENQIDIAVDKILKLKYRYGIIR